MSFLLSSFFAVPVSSTLGFLLLPCAGFSLPSASTVGDFPGLGSCCVWPPPCRGHAEVISARFNLSHGTIHVRGVGNFLDSVLSQQKFEVTDVKAFSMSQLSDRSVLQLCYSSVLFRK